MNAGDLAILVIGGYIVIKYGPQIAANLQQQQAAATPAPAADTTAPAAAAPTPTQPPVNITFTNPSTAPSPQVPAASFGVFPTAPSRFQGVNLAAPFTQNPQASAPTPSPTCVTSTQDAACGDRGHPKCCPGGTLLGTPLQMAAGTGPAVSTRSKTPTPTHVQASAGVTPAVQATGTGGGKAGAGSTGSAGVTLSANPQCGGNVCFNNTCLNPTTGSIVKCTSPTPTHQSGNDRITSAMAQVVNGRRITRIDPYFPAGFYLSQANYRSSLREPALH